MSSSVQVHGAAELMYALRQLPKKVSDGIERKALRKASRAIIVEARNRVPVDDAFLKKSIGVKIRKNKSRASMVAIIGPRRGMGGIDSHTQKPADPVRYAHLVEKGHGGPVPAPPHPFLFPALSAANPFKILSDEIESLMQAAASQLNRGS